MSSILLNNANIVLERNIFHGGILIDGEKIKKLVAENEKVQADYTEDINGMYIFPGLVDDHVHFNEPGRTDWEGYQTGTMAAAAGGVTTILEMPLNSIPPSINAQYLTTKRQAVEKKAIVDYGQWGGLVPNNISDLTGLHKEGVIGYKAFLCNSGVEEFSRIEDDILFVGLQFSKEVNNVIGVHAENEYVTKYLSEKLRSEGRTDRKAWCEARPPEVELEAIKRACFWASVTNGNLHIVHVSIADGIRAIAESKRKGVRVTSETCPHYLCLNEEDFERLGPIAKCAPPLRSQVEVEALWECVKEGLVDTIASDHSPCTYDLKETGMDNIWKAWGGISGIQTMLPAILTEGFHKRGLPLTDLSRMMSTNPAKIFGLYPQKGVIEPGSDADLVIVDLEREWVLQKSDLFYKNKHSPFIGKLFKGQIVKTYLRGKSVYQEGKILVEPGYGKLIKRKGNIQ